MSHALAAAELRRYTRTQIDTATKVVEAHQPDAVGCCTACGRITLCPAVVDALQAIRRFDAARATSTPAPATANKRTHHRLTRPPTATPPAGH